MNKIAGKNARRVDGIEKVTGKALYTGDLQLPGLAYAKLLRSPVAHARLTKVDASRAKQITGVIATLTRDDIKDFNYKYGATYKDQCIVAVDKVRYVGDPIAAVLAMTDDFEAAVVTGRHDRELVPERLRAKQTPEAAALAAEAAQGMRIIDREMQLLTPPDEAELGQAYSRLKERHGEVFGWLPPDVGGLERLGATRMRQYVRTWINEWDLVRLDPSYRPETEMAEVSSDYREDPDLETSGDIAGSD